MATQQQQVYEHVIGGRTGRAANQGANAVRSGETAALRQAQPLGVPANDFNMATAMQPAASTSANVLQWLSSKLWYPLNATFFGPIAVGALAVPAWPLTKLGNLTNSTTLTRWGGNIEGLRTRAKNGLKSLAEMEVGDLAHSASSLVKKVEDSKLTGKIKTLIPPASAAVSTAPLASTTVRGLEEKLFSTAPLAEGKLSFAGNVSTRLGSFANDNLQGPAQWNSRRHFRQADVLLASDRFLRKSASSHLTTLADSLARLGALDGHAEAGPHVAKIAQANEVLKASAAGPAAAIDHAAVNAALGDMKQGIDALGKLKLKEHSKTLIDAGKASGKLEATFGKVLGKAASGHAFADIGKTISEAPEAFGKMKLTDATMKGALIAGSLAAYAKDLGGIAQHIHALQKLDAEMGGKGGDSSKLHVLLSPHVPKIVAEGRRQLFKQFGPAMVIDTAMAGVNMAFARKGASMMALMPMMAVPMVAGAFVPQGTLLPLYTGMSKAHGEKQHLPVASYATLICAASPQIASVGADNGLVHALAKDFEAKQVAPADLMKQIESGELDRVAAAKSKELAAAGRVAGEKVAALALPAQKVTASVTAAVAPVKAANQNMIPTPRISAMTPHGRIAHDHGQTAAIS